MVEPVEVASPDGITLRGDRWPAVGEARGTALLLHGGGQTRHSWSATGAKLAAAGWNAVSMDTRGHGDSDWAPSGDYTMQSLVRDLRLTVEQLGEKPVLIGASMGGLTSLVACGVDPGFARAMVLVDIVVTPDASGVKRINDFMTAKPEGFATLDEVADAIAAYNPHRPRPTNLEGLRKNVRQGADGRWRWHWDPRMLSIGDEPTRETRRELLREIAAKVTIPTLIVRGLQSDVVTDEALAETLALIPHAQVIKVEAAGHMVAGDDNDVFTIGLLEFLASV